MLERKPIRMCIVCKQRGFQDTLIRLQQKGDSIFLFQGFGRSFYVCHNCMDDAKKRVGLAKRFKVNSENFDKLLKEIDG